jgi:hypothetical protein
VGLAFFAKPAFNSLKPEFNFQSKRTFSGNVIEPSSHISMVQFVSIRVTSYVKYYYFFQLTAQASSDVATVHAKARSL